MKKEVRVGISLGVSLLLAVSFGQTVLAEEIVHEVKQEFIDGSGIVMEDKPVINQTNQEKIHPFSILPQKFDPSSGNVQTIMRNQGELGLCWAYSALDVITTSNKKEFNVEYTLSPNYYNYFSAKNAFLNSSNPYGIRSLNDGGNESYIFMQSFLNNNGTLEETFPTPQLISLNNPIPINEFQNIQNNKSPIYIESTEKIGGISYNNHTESKQRQKVQDLKEMIYQHGAATFSYRTLASHDSKYYNSTERASYVSITDVGTKLVPKYGENWIVTDHGVTIVGWDDHFSRDNFKSIPKNDGAFLVKNSWGEGDRNGVGYFHISYEDVYILCSENYSVDTKMTQFDNVNSYVNSVRTHYIDLSSKSKSVYLASVYQTGEYAEILRAISFYSEQAGSAYDVFYMDKAVNSRETINNKENMMKIASGTVTEAGIREIPTDVVEIEANKEYTIIVQVKYPEDVDSFHVILQEVRDASKGKFPDLAEGKTFVSHENDQNKIFWRGASDGDYFGGFKANLYLNAYTDDIIPVEKIKIDSSSKELFMNETMQLKVNIFPEKATKKGIIWKSSDDSVAVVSQNGVVTGKKNGKVKITALSEQDQISDTIDLVFKDGNYFGSVRWEWDEATQTLKFVSSGEFPATNKNSNIHKIIEKNMLLKGKSIKFIRFEKPVQLNNTSEYLFGNLLDLNSWDTGYLTSMRNAFSKTSKLEHIDVSTWNTGNVTNMSGTFSFMSGLQSIDVSNWDIKNVMNMSAMFCSASSLKSIDVSNWNTSNVTDMSYMFSKSKKIKGLDVADWDTSKVLKMNCMFKGAINIQSLEVANWDTGNVVTMSYLFARMDHLKDLDVSKWNISKVDSIAHMFDFDTNLDFLNVSDWDTSAVTNMAHTFSNTRNIRFLDVSKWVTDNAVKMNGTFNQMEKLENLDVSNWNTSCVTDMSEMFHCTYNLQQLNVSNWDTGQVQCMQRMFGGASTLRGLDVSNWDTGKVTNMIGMFSTTREHSLDVSGWDTSNVIYMDSMFYNAENFVELDLSNWDTEKLVSMKNMFRRCEQLEKIRLGNKFVFKDEASLDEKNLSPYTGAWISLDANKKFSSSKDFIESYTGRFAGTYIREKA